MRRKRRLELFQKSFKKKEIDTCVIEDPVDLFYFTGLKLSSGRLWVHQNEVCLFVDARYFELAGRQSLVPVSMQLPENERLFLKKVKATKIGFDSTGLSHQRFLDLQSFFSKSQIPFVLVPLEKPTQEIRLIKDPFEIKDIRHSIQLMKKGYRHLRRMLKEGMTEQQAVKVFELYGVTHGSEGLAFDPIIAFGKNSAMPHYRPGDTKLKKGSIVLVDIGFIVNGYYSDMTRVHFFGTPNPIIMRLLSVTKQAQTAALALCRPGIKVGELDAAAREVMRKENMEQYFPHSLGHGVGLEIHEYPRIKFDGRDKDLVLQPGMVITIEPGLYLPGKGGVRWEDMVLITQNSHENLTA